VKTLPSQTFEATVDTAFLGNRYVLLACKTRINYTRKELKREIESKVRGKTILKGDQLFELSGSFAARTHKRFARC
jgi:hypothetical protein